MKWPMRKPAAASVLVALVALVIMRCAPAWGDEASRSRAANEARETALALRDEKAECRYYAQLCSAFQYSKNALDTFKKEHPDGTYSRDLPTLQMRMMLGEAFLDDSAALLKAAETIRLKHDNSPKCLTCPMPGAAH